MRRWRRCEATADVPKPLVADVTSESDVQRLVRARLPHLRTTRHHGVQCRIRLLRHRRGNADADHAADDGRELHGHVLRCPRGAASLSRRGRGHLIIVSSIVGQRGIAMMSGYSATKAAQVAFAESLRTEFNGTGIAISVVLPVSTETEFRSAMERDYGYSVSGLGPKQSVDDVARCDCRVRAKAEARGVSARIGARAGDRQCRRTGLHRQGREEIRSAPRGPLSAGRSTGARSSFDLAMAIAHARSRRRRPCGHRRWMGPRSVDGAPVQRPRSRGVRAGPPIG